jgi:hypothetical protein
MALILSFQTTLLQPRYKRLPVLVTAFTIFLFSLLYFYFSYKTYFKGELVKLYALDLVIGLLFVITSYRISKQSIYYGYYLIIVSTYCIYILIALRLLWFAVVL